MPLGASICTRTWFRGVLVSLLLLLLIQYEPVSSGFTVSRFMLHVLAGIPVVGLPQFASIQCPCSGVGSSPFAVGKLLPCSHCCRLDS